MTIDKEKAKEAQRKFCEEKGLPHFAPAFGTCWACHQDIYDRISVERASQTLITGCPHCNRSFVD